MSPFFCSVDDLFDIHHTVVITHDRVEVQFHPLLGAAVHSHLSEIRHRLDSPYSTKHQLMSLIITGGSAFNLIEPPLLEMFPKLQRLVISHKDPSCDGIRIIGDGEGEHGFLPLDLPLFQGDNLSPDDSHANLIPDFFDGYGVPVTVSSIEHIRILGIGPPFTKLLHPGSLLIEIALIETVAFLLLILAFLRILAAIPVLLRTTAMFHNQFYLLAEPVLSGSVERFLCFIREVKSHLDLLPESFPEKTFEIFF